MKKSVQESIYCMCRTINDRMRPMIACDNCCKWYHKDCVNLDVHTKRCSDLLFMYQCPSYSRQVNINFDVPVCAFSGTHVELMYCEVIVVMLIVVAT